MSTVTVRRANVGCGGVRPAGWTNIDRIPWGDETGVIFGDIRHTVPGGPYDYIVCHHVLDQLTREELGSALGHLRDALAPRGILRISTPDVLTGIDAWYNRDPGWFPAPFDQGDVHVRFSDWLSCNGRRRNFLDLAGWLAQFGAWSHATVVSAGMSMHDDPAIVDLDTRVCESLFIEALR